MDTIEDCQAYFNLNSETAIRIAVKTL